MVGSNKELLRKNAESWGLIPGVPAKLPLFVCSAGPVYENPEILLARDEQVQEVIFYLSVCDPVKSLTHEEASGMSAWFLTAWALARESVLAVRAKIRTDDSHRHSC